MRTVTSVVEDYIKRNPLLLNALSQRIVNMAALSRDLAHYVEHELNQKVNKGSINMALVRLSRDLDFRSNHKVISLLKQMEDVKVRYNLEEFTFRTSDTFKRNQRIMIGEMSKDKESFFMFSESVKETSVIVSSLRSYVVKNIFCDEKLINFSNKLGSLTLILPNNDLNKSSVLCFIFQMLEWEGILIKKIVSTTNELTILIDSDAIDKATKVIYSLKGEPEFV